MRIVQIKTTASHTHTDVERGPSWDGNAVAALMVWRLVNPQKTELLSLALSLIPNRQVMLQDRGIGGPRKEVTEQDSDKPSVTAAQQIQTFISLN